MNRIHLACLVAAAAPCMALAPAPSARPPNVFCTYAHYSVRDARTIARVQARMDTHSKDREAVLARTRALSAQEGRSALALFSRQQMKALAVEMQRLVAAGDRAWSASFEAPLGEYGVAQESTIVATLDGKPMPAKVKVTLAGPGYISGILQRLDTEDRIKVSSYDEQPTLVGAENQGNAQGQMGFGVCTCSLEVPEADLPKVRSVTHWGHHEEAKDVKEVAVLLDQGFTKLRLGAPMPLAFVELDGHAIALRFVDAREEVPPADKRAERRFCARTIDHCEDSESYLTLTINGHETILLREQLKEVALEDGYRFLISAKDIEDDRERHPSDLVLIRFK